MRQLAKKPSIFNWKLVPLFKRYLTFSKSTTMLATYIIITLSTCFTLFLTPMLLSSFLQLFVLSSLILSSRYGVGEDCIVSILPVSKKQSVLVRCMHLFLTHALVFGSMVVLSYVFPYSMDSGLGAKNKQLAVAVMLFSFAIVNLSLIIFNFCNTKKIKPILVLAGALALFIPPTLLSLLLQSDLPFFANLITNQAASDMILLACVAFFVAACIFACVYSVRHCVKKENFLTASYTTSTGHKKTNQDLDIDSSRDGVFLRAFLKIVAFFGANQNVVKLIRKDFKLTGFPILFGFMALIFSMGYIPILAMFMPIIYVTVLPTILLVLFVAMGDLKFSRLLPVKHKDYVLSKIILTAVIQCSTIVLMYAAYSILNIWEIEIIFVENELRFSFFAILFLAHALANLVFFRMIFKHPNRHRAYTVMGLVYYIAMICGVFIELAITQYYLQLLTILASFVLYILLTILTWHITKNVRTEV